MREYSGRLEREIFSEDGLDEGVEFRDASEEKMFFSRNVFGEPRGVSGFPERKEVCVDVLVLVL